MKKPVKILLPLILIIIAALFIWLAVFRDRTIGDMLVLSGNIEITDANLSFKIQGRLHERLVDEGETVKKGQLIARLDARDEELALKKAQAQLAYSRALLSELETGSRVQEIDDARAALKRALAALQTTRAELERAAADDKRYAELYAEGVISASDYDRFHTLYKTARSTSDEAEARVSSAREQLSLREEGFRKEQIEQARARLAVDLQTLEEARQRLSYTELSAPFDGVVLSKSAESGEYLNPGSPVVTIGDLQHPWIRAYVSETDLGRIKLGQKVEVRTDTWPGKVFNGRVSFISSEAEFTPKIVQTFEERVKLVYRIKINVENPKGEFKPGMPADGYIQFEEK
jgi:HlyD family secretion protein